MGKWGSGEWKREVEAGWCLRWERGNEGRFKQKGFGLFCFWDWEKEKGGWAGLCNWVWVYKT